MAGIEKSLRMSRSPQAILFDMDGTLTCPLLDFPTIKREMGIGHRPILEALEQMSPQDRQSAEAVLLRHEAHAAEHATANPGCEQVIAYLQSAQIPTALITRNSRLSTQQVLDKLQLQFRVIFTREDGPVKPHPHQLLEACRQLSVEPAAAWMVGDGEYDIAAAEAAGIRGIWISHGRTRPFAAQPWKTCVDLSELLAFVQQSAGL